jgi:hypothetical protein
MKNRTIDNVQDCDSYKNVVNVCVFVLLLFVSNKFWTFQCSIPFVCYIFQYDYCLYNKLKLRSARNVRLRSIRLYTHPNFILPTDSWYTCQVIIFREVLTVVNVKNNNMILCSLVYFCRCFGKNRCLHLEGRRVSWTSKWYREVGTRTRRGPMRNFLQVRYTPLSSRLGQHVPYKRRYNL